ncbi:MAG: TlpA family protein disulfide reductase [Muribaculaceae bacterium]|nr:TlpA family protein disulfide reductase [Muribaculaceae bacterium]
MKKLAFMAVAGVMLASCSHDDGSVTIQLPSDYKEKTIVVNYSTIDNMMNATQADDVVVYYDTLEVKDGKAFMKLDKTGAARYNIIPPVLTRIQPEFYASPSDNLEVIISSFEPCEYEVKGSELMEDITAFYKITRPIQQEYVERNSGDTFMTPEEAHELWNRYDQEIIKFVEAHPKSPVVPFAIININAEDFKRLYDNMTPEAKKSILMPYAEANNTEVEKALQERAAEDARKAEMASGTVAAPGFTLPDLDGKNVSLSDFRGKWVVLDFWGSWCGWCIKGFPALKEAFNKYGDKIVVIGIGCNEPEADWRAGVKKYELPWINLYNGENRALYDDYNVEGFPTKVIINPEGKIVDLTTGEDPAFFTRLASFVK